MGENILRDVLINPKALVGISNYREMTIWEARVELVELIMISKVVL